MDSFAPANIFLVSTVTPPPATTYSASPHTTTLSAKGKPAVTTTTNYLTTWRGPRTEAAGLTRTPTTATRRPFSRALRLGAANSLNQIGQHAVRRNLNIQPTLTIRPGFPVRVLVSRDLVLEPYRE
jgi:hypothetical protein